MKVFRSLERDACRILRLLHEDKLTGQDGIYHRVGTFTMLDADGTLDYAIQKYQEMIRRLIEIAQHHMTAAHDLNNAHSYDELFDLAFRTDILSFHEFEAALRR